MTIELRHGSPEEAGFDSHQIERVREICEEWVADGVTRALVVLAARRGVIALHEAYGEQDPETHAPLQRDAVFPILSMTKSLTAAVVMQLVEAGKIGLVRPFGEYLADLRIAGADQILVHHLLTHLSGFRDIDVAREILSKRAELGEQNDDPSADGSGDVTTYVRQAAGIVPDSPIGEAMQYCQFNYELLGEIVNRVTGEGIAEVARKQLFAPLGMESSGYVLPADLRTRKALRAAHEPLAERVSDLSIAGIDSPRWDSAPYAASGAHSSAPDIAAFGQMLLNGGTYGPAKVLSRASVEAMTRSQVPPDVPARWTRMIEGEVMKYEFDGGYGYGLFPFEGAVGARLNGHLASPSTFGHAGAGGTAFWIDPDRELVGVYMSVLSDMHEDGTPVWRADIFGDLIAAAVT